jgi:hypothetical protein
VSDWSLGARAALVVGSLLAGAVGWYAVSQVGADDQSGTAAGMVDLFSCPIDGAKSIGQLHADDQVWLMGVSADRRWVVVRHPDDPSRPAWAPSALISTSADAGDLPEMGCDLNPVTGTTAPPTTVPPTTIAGAPTTASTTTSSTTSTSTTTTTTIPLDTTPPTVTLATNRAYLYVAPAAKCPLEAELEVTVTVADPTVPLTLRSIVATWASPAGPQTANLTPIAGNRFRLAISANGPTAGELPVTITATAADGANNVGTGVTTVSLRNPTTFGCA